MPLKTRLSRVCALVAILSVSPPMTAQMWEEELPEDFAEFWQPAPTPEGALSWDVLTDIEVGHAMIDNFMQYVPTFTPAVEAIHGTKIKLNGYMVPMEPDDYQERFVLTPYPHTCPFHMPAGPGGFVEVQADFPVKYAYDPVLIEGHFQILTDFSGGIFYKISAARQVPAD